MDSDSHVLTTPFWLFGVRIAQVVLSIVVLGLCAAWTGWGIGDAPAMGIAAAVFTWFVVAYQVVTEKLAPARAFYHIIAVLALDVYMIIIWLCAWALNAARASTLPDIDGRFADFDGDDFCFSGICFKTKRSIGRRAVKYRSLKGLLGGAAGIGALVWLLFIGTFVWTLLSFLRGRKDGRFPLKTMSSSNTGHVAEEGKVAPTQEQPVQPQYNGQEQYQHQQPVQYTGQEQYPQQPIPAEYNNQDPNQVPPQQQPHQQ